MVNCIKAVFQLVANTLQIAKTVLLQLLMSSAPASGSANGFEFWLDYDSKLNILDTITQDINIPNINISILFYVVSDDSMSYPSILFHYEILKLVLVNDLQMIEKDTEVHVDVNNFMNVDVDIDYSPNLKINENLHFSTVSKGICTILILMKQFYAILQGI
ncbi:hypothetical protein RN001_005861 [Aquatica leii]|uniref:Uncharacterized protein n=1 Tax=Aquatica leii TaxID=1421715 RepID=A0AAN7SI92_9COLE|nr:hypothetical protein RN001_005861 [Aquatica leii]